MVSEHQDVYPYGYRRTATTEELRARWESLESGTEAPDGPVRVAGRLRTLRRHGKVAFADLEDGTGEVQLFAQTDVLGSERVGEFGGLSVGDIVGAEGRVMKTRRGELSVKVGSFDLLAPCRRPMPEKWHGLTDVESRYRQRHLDLIFNPQSRRLVETRAGANAAIRRLLEGEGFLEVETPLLHPIAGGAVARPFSTHYNALDIDLYLRIAPELHLKRLLIGGLEKVYELNRSFRNEGVSARHNPEFTMLEAYEAYVDYTRTMSLVESLVVAIARAVGEVMPEGAPDLELDPPFARISMFEAIAVATGLDLTEAWFEERWDSVRAEAEALGVRVDPAWPPGKVLAEIYESRAERELTGPVFVTGFPKDVSPLAKDHRTIPGFTEHADLVMKGVEIAPIYSELNDPEEQRRRFQAQAAARAAGDEEATLPDEDFLEALAYGMPPAGGFGLGIDRLLMFLTDTPSIREVILWPTLKPEG